MFCPYYKAIVAGSIINSMVTGEIVDEYFFFLASNNWSKPVVNFNFSKIQNLLQNAELGIYIILFEKQSRIDSSGI